MAAKRIPIFPLPGVVLYPGLQLPLHIFEPRYRAMISETLVRDRLIGMIQPQKPHEGAPLYGVGCIGKIDQVEALADGRFNIVLEGQSRFRTLRELEVRTPFRQVEAELIAESIWHPSSAPASSARRAALPRRRATAWTGRSWCGWTTKR